jgi:hypothetical protein
MTKLVRASLTLVGSEADRMQRRELPGHVYDIMLSNGESLSAGEVARHGGPYHDIRALGRFW